MNTRELGAQLQNLCLRIGKGEISLEEIRRETGEMRRKGQSLGMTEFVQDCDEILAAVGETPIEHNK
jgi:hypothetical protein